ncbi:MAG TPA: hypothetical protein VIJ20_03310 [Solirubrobacteraceae bacterium]
MNLIESGLRPETPGDPEAHWRSHGWGPKWKFPATRSDGARLVLSLRVPLDWKATDVMKMPAEAATKSGSLAEVVATLARGIDAAGVIAIMAIGYDFPREGKPNSELYVMLNVALKDVPGPLPESILGADVEPVEFKHPGGDYRGVRIRRVSDGAALPDQPPQPILTVQYMLRTEHGVLATTFMTPQVGVFEKLVPLLDKIADGCSLELEARAPSAG